MLLLIAIGTPSLASDGGAATAGRENASFVYQPFTTQDLPIAGTPTHDGADAPGRRRRGVAATGATVYKYLQFNWFPATEDWNGTTPTQRMPWRLCGAVRHARR